MATGYGYRPLDVEKDEIRLLSIDYRPFREHEPLKFRLEHANFKDGVPEFIAVSYVWGDATERRNILVNGQDVSVPENAEIALRRLHHAVFISSLDFIKPRGTDSLGRQRVRLWIDSICVNQSDFQERGQQVPIMWRIYSLARFVLIWLGPDDGKTRSAIEAINSLIDDMRSETNDFEDAGIIMWSREGRYGNRKSSELDLNHLPWPAIEAFYSSSWFQRLWVVQETVLAKEAFCVRGDSVIPWTSVGRAAHWLDYRRYYSRLNLDRRVLGVENAGAIQDYKDGYVDRSNVVLQARRLQTSNAHDKVFGFLALLQTTENGIEILRTITHPDYSVPVDVLYGEVTRAYIRIDESLRIFVHAHNALFKYKDQQPDLTRPSWILRMDIDEVDGPWDLRSYPASGKDACNGSLPKLVATIKDPRVLSISGHVFSQIRALAPCEIYLEDGMEWNELKRFITTSYEFASRFGCPSWAAFGRIFLLDLMAGPADGLDEVSWTDWPAFLTWCTSEDASDEIAEYYCTLLDRVAHGRRLFVTRNGVLGMGTWNVKIGDDVCILSGGKVPYVLRPANGHTDSWRLVGDAYVDGIMDGEYIQQLEQEGRLEAESRWINIR